MITLTLPYPVSCNRYWRTRVVKGVAMTYVSPEAKAYKREVALAAKTAGVLRPISGRVAVSYMLYPHRPQDWKRRAVRDPAGWDDSVACLDLDNCQKVLLDALKGVAFDDDRWVRRIEATRAEPDGEGRLVVTVRRIESAAPQIELIS